MRRVAISICLAVFLLGVLFPLHAQNHAPDVSNVRVSIDRSTNQMEILYDLVDPDDAQVAVSIAVSVDSGSTWQPVQQGVIGDVGSAVSPGTDRRMVWDIRALGGLDPSGIGIESGRVMIAAEDGHPVDLAAILARIDSNQIREDLQWIQGIRQRFGNPQHLANVIDSIITRFQEGGLYTRTLPFRYVTGYQAKNVEGTRIGLKAPKSVVILAGHFDSVNYCPGADDNASAIAALFAMLRALDGVVTEKTLRFAAFDLEEVGMAGSFNYVDRPSLTRESLLGAIVLECIGFWSDQPGSQTLPAGFEILFPEVAAELNAEGARGNFVLNVANDPSSDLRDHFRAAATDLVPELRVKSVTSPGDGSMVPDLQRSDHAPFWAIGVPALMITDGANFRNPNYHKSTDIWETLTFSFLAQVTKASLATALRLASPLHGSMAVSAPIDFVVTSSDVIPDAEADLVLEPCRPQPVSTVARLGFRVREPVQLTLCVTNLMGQQVWKETLTCPAPGAYSTSIPTSSLPAGTYVYSVTGARTIRVGRFQLLR